MMAPFRSLIIRCFGFLLAIAPTVLSPVFVAPIAHAEPPLEVLEQEAFQAAALYAQDSVVQVETFGGSELVRDQLVASGPASGTILTADGWIITSTFQFKGQPASITVVLPNQDRKAAKLVARDVSRELALLKIDVDQPLRPIQISPAKDWQIGQWVVALGKTFDPATASCSVGILSAQGRVWNKAIQTDAKISPQNYGGPLVDLQGRAMGILTPLNPGIVTEGEVEQWYDSGIGFAVPTQDVLQRLPELQQGNDIHPGRVGFRWRGIDEYSGSIVLQGITPGSPAAKAGIRAGDRILAVGPTKDQLVRIENVSQMKHVMGPMDAGMTLSILKERDGREQTVECKLVKELPTYREPFLGILIDPSDPDAPGKVSGLIPASPALAAGIAIGDTIVAIQGEPISKETPVDSRLASLDFRDSVEIELRGGDGAVRKVQAALTPHPEDPREWDYRPPTLDPTKNAGIANEAARADAAKGTIQLPLGDVKNKAFAMVPNTYNPNVPHGLLIVFADAGIQDQKLWTDAWEPFAREHRWIIAVAQSAEENTWSFDEVEIGMRLQSYMSKTYAIDRRRIAVGGIESGSLLAYITAMQAQEVYRGVWMCNPKLPPRFRMPPCEPFKATHYFINGSEKVLERFTEIARKAGYSVQASGATLETAKLPESPLLQPLQGWLRLLEAY
jgi:serine protease Do